MRKMFYCFLLLVVIGVIMPMAVMAAEDAPIQEDVEISPRNDPQHPVCSIAMQAVWDPRRLIWRRQIILFNGATEDLVTDQMKTKAKTLLPTRKGLRDWESWKFTWLYPAGGTVSTVAKVDTAKPASGIQAPAQPIATADNAELARLKAELAAKNAQLAAKKTAPAPVVAKKAVAKPTKKAAPTVAYAKKSEHDALAARVETLEDEQCGFCEGDEARITNAEKAIADITGKVGVKPDLSGLAKEGDLKNLEKKVDESTQGGVDWIKWLALLAAIAAIVCAVVALTRRSSATPAAPPAAGPTI